MTSFVPLKQFFSRRLTGRETLAVILGVGLLAGAGHFAWQFIAAQLMEARVNDALPKVCGDIREQRDKVASAIEAYKVRFGVYPPDHVLSRQPLVVDPVTNTLFYELTGVVFDPTNKMFQAGGMEPAEEKYVKEFFQIEGFRNCAENPAKITLLLDLKPTPVRQLHDDPDVFALGFQVYRQDLDPELTWEFDASTWRYVSSSPTNNPGKFDLWLELKTRNKKLVIGNWKAVE